MNAPFSQNQAKTRSRSRALMEEARRYTPGGVHSSIRRMPVDIVLNRADGAYLWDVDGNRYVDYNAAFAAIILGHSHPGVDQAVAREVQGLDLAGLGTTPHEIALNRTLVTHVPSAEMSLLCNSGSEATYHAVRLARAYTGRDHLLKFQGCYHGWHDYLLVNVLSTADKIGTKDPASTGMLPEAIARTSVLDFNDLEGASSALRTRKFAAVILEPIAHNMGCVVGTEPFLRGLRELCNETGTILVFDEVISGFRHGMGGYQAVVGVTPDLTTLGKAMSNGYPCAAIVGKQELMLQFATAGGPVFFAGTHNGHTAGTVAALATIAELENGEIHKQLFDLGDRLCAGLSEVASRVGVPMRVEGYGSVFTPYFVDPDRGPLQNYTQLVQRNDDAKDMRFRLALIERGILVFPGPRRRWCITAAHTRADVDLTLNVAEEVLRTLR